MDIKKLIGTIIGVILFVALIAGATFAWLTFGTTLVSTNVNSANTMNFLVDYIFLVSLFFFYSNQYLPL